MCQNLNTWGGFWMEQEAGTDEGEYCEKVRSLPNDRGLQLQCAREREMSPPPPLIIRLNTFIRRK